MTDKLIFGSDHGGFELKQRLLDWVVEVSGLDLHKIELSDYGAFELEPQDDYPDYAFKVAEIVAKNPTSLGVLICRSGNGMAIAANKVAGIRAALCFNEHHAKMARQDDYANILVLDADYSDFENHTKVLISFLTSQPSLEDRHLRRVSKITDYEKNND